MNELKASEVSVHPHSICDPNGQVFTWQGGLYRGVRERWLPVWDRLHQDGLLSRLMERGLLVQTEPATVAKEGFAAVLKHHRIPFVSYPHEWPERAFRDAALLMVDLLMELSPHQLTLQDGHFGNIMLNGARPVYIDLTSIVDRGRHPVWPSYSEFLIAAVYPLLLYVHGHDRIARLLSWEDDGVMEKEVDAMLGPEVTRRFQDLPGKSGRSGFQKRRDSVLRRVGLSGNGQSNRFDKAALDQRSMRFLKSLRTELQALDLPGAGESGGADGKRTTAVFAREFENVLGTLNPKSVLCTGDDVHRYASMAASSGRNVIAASSDAKIVDRMYATEGGSSRSVFPLVLDVVRPTPLQGVLGYAAVAATERLSCELMAGFGLVKSVVFDRRLTFRHAVESMRLFAKRAVLVDFMQPAHRDLRDAAAEMMSWYHEPEFLRELEKVFPKVSRVPCTVDDVVLFLAER